MKQQEKQLCMRELGCQAAVKFRMTTCADLRINMVYILVLACGVFVILAQLLTRNFDTTRLLCTSNQFSEVIEMTRSEPTYVENLKTLPPDASRGERRVFKPHGIATHLFIEMGAYRGSALEFSIVGLVAKPIQSFHEPPYECEWRGKGEVRKGKAHKMLPDWNYGKLYTVVVITCTFRESVGVKGEGGTLLLKVGYGDPYRIPEEFPVLEEQPGEYNATKFNPPYPYDYVYCGSSIYGDVSPQRVREWLAYHAYLFGERSHFIFHDAGGIHPDVWTVLDPWVKAGRVSVQNVRQQEIYDGYYHNQFLVVNDCLFRSRFMANWTFFFDVDEYIYVAPTTTLDKVLNADPNVTQITIEQVPISENICVADNTTIDGHARYAYEPVHGFITVLGSALSNGPSKLWVESSVYYYIHTLLLSVMSTYKNEIVCLTNEVEATSFIPHLKINCDVA